MPRSIAAPGALLARRASAAISCAGELPRQLLGPAPGDRGGVEGHSLMARPSAMSTSTPRCSQRLPASQLVSEANRQAWQAATCSWSLGGSGTRSRAQRVGGAGLRVFEGLVEQPAEEPRVGEGDQAAERALAVAGGGGQQHPGGRVVAGADVEAFADAGRGVAALERDLAQQQVAERVQQQVARDREAGIGCEVTVAAPPARRTTRSASICGWSVDLRAPGGDLGLAQLEEDALAASLDGGHPADPADRQRGAERRLQVAGGRCVDAGEADHRLHLAQPLHLHDLAQQAGVLARGVGVGTARKSSSCCVVVGWLNSCHSASSRPGGARRRLLLGAPVTRSASTAAVSSSADSSRSACRAGMPATTAASTSGDGCADSTSQCSAMVAATGSSCGRCSALTVTPNHRFEAPSTISLSGWSQGPKVCRCGWRPRQRGRFAAPLGAGRRGDVAGGAARRRS